MCSEHVLRVNNTDLNLYFINKLHNYNTYYQISINVVGLFFIN